MAGTGYRRDEVKVGALVLAALAVLAVFLAAVLGLRLGPRAGYHVRFRNVAGLEEGSPVTYGGFQVGRVAAIRVEEAGAGLLDIQLSLDAEVRLPRGTRATVNAPIFGETRLELVPGDPAEGYLEPGAEVAGEEPFDLNAALKSAESLVRQAGETVAELRATLEEVSGQVNGVLAHVDDLLGEENRERVGSLLAQADVAVRDATPKISRTLDRVEAASVSLQETSDSARKLVGNLDGLVGENREELDALIASAAASAAQMRDAVAGLNRLLGSQKGSLEETMANLHETSENLVELTRLLKERPWSLVRKTKPREEGNMSPRGGAEALP
jgi:phospholipid/cholesterol/gamma-HCH transport system substrate-binding protein